MLRTSFNSGWRVRKRVSPFQEVRGEAAPGTPITLPHDWLIEQQRSADAVPGAPTGYYPDGIAHYYATFAQPTGNREQHIELEFDGVYRHAVVMVNDSVVAQRPSGYSPFSVRIDQYLVPGDNEIAVDCRSHSDSRWYSGLGIYRDVNLLTAGSIHVTRHGVRITTREATAEYAVIDVETRIQNDRASFATVQLGTRLSDPQGAPVAADSATLSLRPNGDGVLRQRFRIEHPQTWDLESPQLYRCDTTVTHGEIVDETTTTFGVRTISWDHAEGFRLNGRTVKLRGGAVHHDNGVIGAATIRRADERRVEILKAAGYNAIRSAHNPISTALLEACDRHGMLVMDEAFDTWLTSKADFDYSLDLAAWWERDLTEMVERDYNHPSVIAYSIGNEIPEVARPFDVPLGRDLVDCVKRLDPSRPVTNGVNAILAVLTEAKKTVGKEHSLAGINTFLAEFGDRIPELVVSDRITDAIDEAQSQLDIAGYNYAAARYEVDMLRHPQRLFVGTESNAGDLDQIWDVVKKHPQVVGDFSWTAWDYIGEAGIGRFPDLFGPFPWRLAGVGDIDITGRRQPVSYWREIVWGLREEPNIAVHRPETFAAPPEVGPWAWDDVHNTWSWTGADGTRTGVQVYADADEVELRLDGRTIGRSPVGSGKRRFIAEFEVEYQPGTLTAVAYVAGVERSRASLTSSGPMTGLTLVADRPVIRADDGDLAYVEILVTDAAGGVPATSDTDIVVEIEGAGMLQGLGSAALASEDDYASATTRTFLGRALAVIRPQRAGDIRVLARSADGSHAEITVRAE